jgi:hypothetical protein
MHSVGFKAGALAIVSGSVVLAAFRRLQGNLAHNKHPSP